MMRCRDASAREYLRRHQRCQDISMTKVDPVCSMTVDPQHAAGQYEYKGETYYFCSTHCLHKFREDPERFLAPTTAPTTQLTRQKAPAQPEPLQQAARTGQKIEYT